jgi:hypothetical protein
MGIVIDSSGVINVAASTPGTYRITYTTAGTCPSSSTQDVTINALDNAAFSYSASSYTTADADPTPTITGLTGGTFSAGSGLVFVDSGTNTGSSTGEIDLSASTVASYTITYDTTSSGSSVCPNTSTQTVEIAVAGIANNYSMSFDGSSQYISIDTNGSFPFGLMNTGVSSTVSLWAKLDTLSQGGNVVLFEQRNVSARYVIWFNDSNNTINFYPNAVKQSQAVNANQWYHIVATLDGTNARFYVDGSEVGTASTYTPTNTNQELEIGRSPTLKSQYFDGSIDEVAIWNTVLTSTQVSEIYNGTGTNTTKDLSTIELSNLKYWNRMGD